MTGGFCPFRPPHGGSERVPAMVIRLDNGGTVTVTESGSVEYRRDRETAWTPGRGSYAETVEWVESVTSGDAGVLFTSRRAWTHADVAPFGMRRGKGEIMGNTFVALNIDGDARFYGLGVRGVGHVVLIPSGMHSDPLACESVEKACDGKPLDSARLAEKFTGDKRCA